MVEHVLRKLKLRTYVTYTYVHIIMHILYLFNICCSTRDALYEDPVLLHQLQANPAYGLVPTSTVKVEKGDEEYETCNM